MITKYSQNVQRARAGCHQKTDVVSSCQFVVEHDTKPPKRRDVLRTWQMLRHGGGIITGLMRVPRPVNIISLDFEQFSFRLFSSKCTDSLAMVSTAELSVVHFGTSVALSRIRIVCSCVRQAATLSARARYCWSAIVK